MQTFSSRPGSVLKPIRKIITICLCISTILVVSTNISLAKSGYVICKNWNNIAQETKDNLDIIESVMKNSNTKSGMNNGKYPVALYETTSPSPIREAVEKDYDSFYGVGNFDLRLGGPTDSRSAILVLFVDTNGPTINAVAQKIYEFISMPIISSDAIDTDEKRKNYAINLTESFFDVTAASPENSYEFKYTIENEGGSSNFMIYFIRKNKDVDVTSENLHNLAKSFADFAGIPSIPTLKDSIFSADNVDATPTNADIALATAISGPNGFMGWKERYDNINAKCLEP